MHIPGIKYIYLQSFMFVGVSVIEILHGKEAEEEDEGRTWQPVLHIDFFSYIVIFQHVLHFGVGISQIE